MTEATGGRAVVDALVAHGVELVFGIPGTHNLEIYRHLGPAPIRHVTPRHEQGAGYAADGYARTSGRPGVCVVTTGPGVTNIATAAATAYADSVPMLVISPGLPRVLEGAGSGYLHEVKAQSRAMDGVVAWSRRVHSPGEAATAVADAFELFGSARPRPVHVEIPIDVLDTPAPVGDSPLGRARPPRPDAEAIERAAALLAAAERPLLILGGGARGAARPARALAERLDAPVLTTVAGKGVVDERHPLSLGAAIRLRAAQRFAAERDVVVVVGSELADSDLWEGALRLAGKAVRIDIDRAQLDRNAPADVAILGDAATALGALVERLGTTPRRAGEGASVAAELRRELADEALADGGPYVALHRALAEVLAGDAIIAGDSARACYFGTVHLLPMREPSCFPYPTGYATLGYGLPAAIGAKLAHPDRQVVALMGDGGAMFTLPELATAVELALAIALIVVNDGGYGEIRDEMRSRGIDPLGVDLRAPDFAAVGRAFGAAGVAVQEPGDLAEALGAALEAAGPTVIEVAA